MRNATLATALALIVLASAGCLDLAPFNGAAPSDASAATSEGMPAAADSARPAIPNDLQAPSDLSDSQVDTKAPSDGTDGQAPGDTVSDTTRDREGVLPLTPDSGLVVSCKKDSECLATENCCNNRCVSENRPDHCGGCSNACTPVLQVCCSGKCVSTFPSAPC